MTDLIIPADPLGYAVLLIDPDGHVIAETTDFERSGYGGFTLKQAQRIRCNDQLWRAALDRLCSPIISKAAGSYHGPAIIEEMVRKHGYRIHEIAIGHRDD